MKHTPGRPVTVATVPNESSKLPEIVKILGSCGIRYCTAKADTDNTRVRVLHSQRGAARAAISELVRVW